MTPEERLEQLVEAERTQAPTGASMERAFERLQQALGAQLPPIDIGPADPTLLAGSSALGKLVTLPWVAKVTAIAGVVASTGALVGSHTGSADRPPLPPAALASARAQPAATAAGSDASARSGVARAEADTESASIAPRDVPRARAAAARPMPFQGAIDSVEPVGASSTTLQERSQAAPDVRRPAVKAFDEVPPNHIPSAPAFDAELVLIKRAKAEFDAGRAESARAWLSEHARRFPAGVFAAERDGLLVLSACRANPAAGGAGASAFLRRYPQSPLAARIRRSCGLE